MFVVLRNHNVLRYSAYKTPATSEYFFEFSNRSEIPALLDLVREVSERGLPIIHIGAGTNCLFAFDHFPGLIIRSFLKGFQFSESIDGTFRLQAESAELISPLSSLASTQYQISTLLPWVGLPGTVGGAVVGNAGCFGLSTSDILLSAEVLDLNSGAIVRYSQQDLEYSYRNSRLK